MNQDIAVSDTGGIRLAVPVQPFQLRPGCPKCGSTPPSWLANLSNALQGSSRMSAVRTSFCGGSLPPSEEIRGIGAVFSGTSERQNSCAGVDRQHLHAQCAACGYGWLMECQDRKA